MAELKHLGLIIDGNRRHAKKYGMSLKEAYRVGAFKVRLALDWVFTEFKIPELSIYALSHDNLNRPFVQLSPVFHVQAKEYEKWLSDPFFENSGTKVSFYGHFGSLPSYYIDSCKKIAEKTKDCAKKKLNILVGYNGQREIAAAVRKWLENQREKTVAQVIGELDAADPPANGVGHLRNHFWKNMDVQTPLDLVIRTGLGIRNSGFLTWQSEYAELYGIQKLWPEMTKEDFTVAIENFKKQPRKRGK